MSIFGDAVDAAIEQRWQARLGKRPERSDVRRECEPLAKLLVDMWTDEDRIARAMGES